MRDLCEHPITIDEIIDCLKRFQEEVDPQKTRLCGDMRHLLLARAIDLLERLKN
jgi:hypothetical protein